ncbi:MAG TPA: hypothetical protein VHX17_01245 [Candidatus Cybelea sp.]|jgi:hypothetical protein|nr:hypothetical protein [Candidatus Cybelea sp.]
MLRGVILGALAFGAAFAAERLFAGMKRDLDRYNKMREMSNEEPLFKELLSTAASLLSGSVRKSGVNSFVDSLSEDAVRYAKMRGM